MPTHDDLIDELAATPEVRASVTTLMDGMSRHLHEARAAMHGRTELLPAQVALMRRLSASARLTEEERAVLNRMLELHTVTHADLVPLDRLDTAWALLRQRYVDAVMETGG